MNAVPSVFDSFGIFVRKQVLRFWAWYLAGATALAFTTWITLEIPQVAKAIVNSLSSTDFVTRASETRRLALMVVGLGFLQMIVRTASRILIFWPGRKLETDSKDIVFSRALGVPDRILRKFGMGDLVSRIANDVGHLRVFFAFGALQIANLTFLGIFAVVKMFHVHPTLAALSLLPLGGTFLVFRFVMPRLHKFTLENQAALGRLTNRVTEAFVNYHVIAASNAENAFLARAEVENGQVYATNMKVLFLRMVAFPLMTCLSGISQLVVLFYGGLEVVAGRLTVGDILAFNVYIGLLAFPLTAMGIIAAAYQRAKSALTRLADVAGSPNEEDFVASKSKVANGATAPALEVKHLTYAYERPVLKDVSFSVQPGEKIGIFGPIGSGKSTLFNLITCLESPPPGSIFVGGRDVRDLPPRRLRQAVSYGLQSVHLFSESVQDNVSFGVDPKPSDTELEKSCRLAQVFDEISRFEHGWKTQIGEKGLRLSGGQKQRIGLARLFLRKPDILLLDDVLSAVDQVTEKRLLDAIYDQKTTLIMSTHRPTALRRCDRVLVLRDGRVVDQGRFEDLVTRYPETVAGEETTG